MSLNGPYLPVSRAGTVAIAVCPRCRLKIQYDDLIQDPNDKNWYCSECIDLYDPYRLPARQAEDISLRHPRTEDDLDIPGGVPAVIPN